MTQWLSKMFEHWDMEQLTPSEKMALLLQRPIVSQQKGESALSIQVADFLRRESMAERLKAVWCKLPNEGKRSKQAGALMKALGMVPGAADFVFVWAGGGGWIELKTTSNKSKLSPKQLLFKWWCEHLGILNKECRTVDDVVITLRIWGCLA